MNGTHTSTNIQHHNKHGRRSDWNSGGTHDGTYYKSPAVEAKNTFSYIECKKSGA